MKSIYTITIPKESVALARSILAKMSIEPPTETTELPKETIEGKLRRLSYTLERPPAVMTFRRKRDLLAFAARLKSAEEERKARAPYITDNRFMKLSLIQLGIAILEIAEAVNAKMPLYLEMEQASEEYVSELRKIGANLRDLFLKTLT